MKTSINHQSHVQAAHARILVRKALKPAERIGWPLPSASLTRMNHNSITDGFVAKSALPSSDREQAMPAEIAHLKRARVHWQKGDEELAILQKAAAYLAKRLKMKYVSHRKHQAEPVSKPCAVLQAARSGWYVRHQCRHQINQLSSPPWFVITSSGGIQ